jgi:di/tricarboxylate transporter
LIAEVVGRSITTGTLLALVFLMVPLTVLSYETSKMAQWIAVPMSVSNLEMIVVFATYAAVLSEFISNIPLIPTQF